MNRSMSARSPLFNSQWTTWSWLIICSIWSIWDLVNSFILMFPLIPNRERTWMAFLCPIPSIFVEAILTCESGTDLAPEIYDILNPSPGLLGWNLQWSNQRLYILYRELERQQFLFTIKIILHPYPHSLYASSTLKLFLWFSSSVDLRKEGGVSRHYYRREGARLYPPFFRLDFLSLFLSNSSN